MRKIDNARSITIEPITSIWCDFFKSEIEKDKLQNVYLYIDIKQLGFENKNIKSYTLFENSKPIALLYLYHNSLQLFCLKELNDCAAKKIAEFIIEKKVPRATGKTDAIRKIGKYINGVVTSGYIMQYIGADCSKSSTKAEESDLPEIAWLISNDKNFSGTYTYDSLVSQMSNRMINEGCASRIIKKDGKIVSHFAIFANSDEMVVVSGMVTHPDYRGMGLGSILVRDLSNEIRYTDNKIPILYCYEDEYYGWYQKLGYETIGTSSKFEVIYNE